MTPPQECTSESFPHQVQIACLFSDGRTFASADRQIRALGVQMGSTTSLGVDWLPIARLGHQKGSRSFAKILSNADMFWVSIGTESDLPQPLADALALWIGKKSSRMCAIVALLHMPIRQIGVASSIELELRNSARVHARSIFVRRLIRSGSAFEDRQRMAGLTPLRKQPLRMRRTKEKAKSERRFA